MSEKVLAFPARFVPSRMKSTKILTKKDEDVLSCLLLFILGNGKLSFIERKSAETDASWKQIIPYVLFRKKDSLFSYQRSKQSGEGRLHGKHSIGIGGHINSEDGSAHVTSYSEGCKRELLEEIGYSLDTINVWNSVEGLLYDPSDPVGEVHFGVVHIIDIPEDIEIVSTDYAISEGKFTSIDIIKKNILQYESWSQIVLTNLM